MKATVNTTVKHTISILAAMTFVVACGSKKNNAADGVVGPNAAKSIEGIYKLEGVTCPSSDSVKENTVVGTLLKLSTAGDENRYTETQTAAGPSQTIIGQYKITDGDSTKGKMQFTKFVFAEGEENGTASKDENDMYYADFTFSADDLTLSSVDSSLCEYGFAVKAFKRYAPPVTPVAAAPVEAKGGDVAPGTEQVAPQGEGQPQTLPATPAAPVESDKK